MDNLLIPRTFVALCMTYKIFRGTLRENSSALWKRFSTGKYFPSFLMEKFFHRFLDSRLFICYFTVENSLWQRSIARSIQLLRPLLLLTLNTSRLKIRLFQAAASIQPQRSVVRDRDVSLWLFQAVKRAKRRGGWGEEPLLSKITKVN